MIFCDCIHKKKDRKSIYCSRLRLEQEEMIGKKSCSEHRTKLKNFIEYFVLLLVLSMIIFGWNFVIYLIVSVIKALI